MKTSTTLLFLSIGLNVALGSLGWLRLSDASHASRKETSPVFYAENTSQRHDVEGTVATAREPIWMVKDEKNLDGLIARLRSAGISDRELSAVLLAKITSETGDFIAETRDSQPYWINRDQTDERKWSAEVYRRYVEQRVEMAKYLCTPELFSASESLVENAREQFGDFPIEMLWRLMLIQNDGQRKMLQLAIANMSGGVAGEAVNSPADTAAYQRVRAESDALIKALLSPAQYAQFEMRNSSNAQSLRFRLESFRPTEAEYKAIFAIEKSYSENADLDSLTPVERSAMERKMKGEIAAALGPKRAADYAELDKNGGQLPRLMARLNLPLSTLSTVNEVRDKTTASAKAIRNNGQLTPAQRSVQLDALTSEAERSLTSTLGTEGFDAYADSKGEWLKSLRQSEGAKP